MSVILLSPRPSRQRLSVESQYSAGPEVESAKPSQLGLVGNNLVTSDLAFTLPQNFSAARTVVYPHLPLSKYLSYKIIP